MKQPEDAATVELPLGLEFDPNPAASWPLRLTDDKTAPVWPSTLTNDKKRIDPNWPFPQTIGTPEAARAARRTTNPGAGFRERERLKRKANRWVAKLEKMPATERAFIRAALDAIDESNL